MLKDIIKLYSKECKHYLKEIMEALKQTKYGIEVLVIMTLIEDYSVKVREI